MKLKLLLFSVILLAVAGSLWAAPNITVSASAVSILGTSQTISITVTLVDPNQTGNLKVTGTGVVPIMRASTITPGTTATVGPIYGNDVILDAFGNANNTYYKVQVFTVTNGIVASTPSLQAFYAFQGSGTVDLSTATPLAPSFMSGANGSISMPGSLTVNNAAGAGANDIFLGILNQRRYACSLSAAYRFQTVVAAANDITTNSTTGGIVETCPGHRETITTTFALGTSTKPVIVMGAPDTILTCNVSGGTDCWQAAPNSGFVGQGIFANGGSRTGGFTLNIASTANFGSAISMQQCTGVGGQSSVRLENIFVNGNNSATGTTLVNLCSLNNQPNVNNIFITGMPNVTALLLQASTASGAVLGPISLVNAFVDCNYQAGCRPVKITMGSPANTINHIDFLGGYFNHPGSGLPMMEINGNSNATQALRGIHISSYFENAQNGSSIAIKVVDALAVDFTGSIFQVQDTDTVLDISETAVDRAGGISSSAFMISAPTASCTAVNNHITGTVLPCNINGLFGHYNFGGTTGTRIAAFRIDGNAVNESDGGLLLTGTTVHTTTANQTLNDGLVLTDSEGGGKSWKMFPGAIAVGRFSLVNKTDGPNTEAFGCVNGTTATCGFPGLAIGTTAPTARLGLSFTETTAPSGAASIDACYGDSTLHAIKCSYNNGTFFQIPQVITATSAAFATATTAGTCVQNTTAVTGAATTMAVSVSPVSTPGVGAQWSAFVSSAGNVTINECAVAASAGGTIAFNIRVIP